MSRTIAWLLLCAIPVAATAAPPGNPPPNTSLKVEVQNFPEVQDVSVVPRAGGYMLFATVTEDRGGKATLSVPFASYLQGVLLTSHGWTRDDGCDGARLQYKDSATRPGGANSNFIANARASFPGSPPGAVVHYIATNLYVPLPDLLVAEGVELELDTDCSASAILYLRPRSTGIGGPGDIGF